MTVEIGFAARNVALASAVAITLLDRIEYAVLPQHISSPRCRCCSGSSHGIASGGRRRCSGWACPTTYGDAMTQSEADVRAALEERLRFETLLANPSTGFVGLRPDQVNGVIEGAHSLALERKTTARTIVITWRVDCSWSCYLASRKSVPAVVKWASG